MFKKIKIDPLKLLQVACQIEASDEPEVGVESHVYTEKLLKTPAQIEQEEVRRKAFSTFLKQLRLASRLSIEDLAGRSKINSVYLDKIEGDLDYKPSPRTLMLLAEFYKIPKNVIMQLAGAVANIDEKLGGKMVRFAAMSDSFEKLTSEEKKALHEFVAVLRDYHNSNGARDTNRH